jgi:hypothetical protein
MSFASRIQYAIPGAARKKLIMMKRMKTEYRVGDKNVDANVFTRSTISTPFVTKLRPSFPETLTFTVPKAEHS